VRRVWASLGTLLFLVIAPGTVAGLIPWLLTHWGFRPAFLGQEWLRWIGAVLIVAGLVPLLSSFARFALEGLGTPAPVAPTQTLVVSGFYRYVRNPMYVGVVAMIIGQVLLFSDLGVLVWAAVAWLAMHVFVVSYEEPTLEQRYGAQYANFRSHVPRWIPRLTAWRG